MSRMALNIAHFKKGAVGSLGGHNWYKRGEHDEHSNQDIDPARSKDNIALVLPEEGSFYQDVKSTVEQSTGRVTAASVWVSEWVLYPPESLQNPLTADKEELRRFYGDALTWMREQGYHVKLAVVHMDETTVHAHIDTVPLTEDGRLSRKDVYTRAALNNIHTELAKHLAAKGWDIQRGESTKDKQVRSVSVPEYKKQAEAQKLALVGELGQLKEQTKAEEMAAQEARQDAQEARYEAEAIQTRKEELQASLNRLEAPEEVKSIQGKKALLGDKVTLERSQYETLKAWAEQGAAAVAYGDTMRDENERLREDLQRAEEAASRAMDLQIQNARLERELEQTRKKAEAFEKAQRELLALREAMKADLQHMLADYTQLREAKKEAWGKRSEAEARVKELEAVRDNAPFVRAMIARMQLLGATKEAQAAAEKHEKLCAAVRAEKHRIKEQQAEMAKQKADMDKTLEAGVAAAVRPDREQQRGRTQSRSR